MKKIYKLILMTFVVSSTMFYSCDSLELELLTSPNALSPDKADADLLLNSIQLAYRSNQRSFQGNSAALARIDYMGGRNYFNNFGSGTLSGVWSRFYTNMLVNTKAIAGLQELNPDKDFSFHLGISKTLQAHTLMQLVDFLGDIPWSEALNPSEYPSPNVDDDAAVYAAAMTLLEEAKVLFSGTTGIGSALDMYYGGDESKWIKLVNTIKMRADLTMGNYSSVVNATNVISSPADDFVFNYGTNVLSPDTRHPDYASDYTSSGANIYQSNWLMNLMTGDNDEWYNLWGVWQQGDALPLNDPRRRYYFYRQSWNTPGSFSMLFHSAAGTGAWPDFFGTTSTNGETLSCSLQDVPNHLEFTPDENIWCNVKIGYWGRTHGNDEGTPPDGFTRTAVGVYPAGGSFDNQHDIPFYQGGSGVGNLPTGAVGLGNGGGGAGIDPIYLSSYVHFMKAEAALATGASASAHLEAGIKASITKVMGFSSLDSDADSDLFPSTTEVSTYVTAIMAQYNAAPATSALDGFGYPVTKDKMDILGEQYFIAMFGGAADAFNFIRRTGYPRTIARNLEGNPGLFPRTVLYPGSEIIANPNILQRTDNSTKVFWDNGVLNPAN